MTPITRQQIVDAFENARFCYFALEAAGQEPDESDMLLDDMGEAFSLAMHAGWNWEDDWDWIDWQLKATRLEIIEEGLCRALKHCNLVSGE